MRAFPIRSLRVAALVFAVVGTTLLQLIAASPNEPESLTVDPSFNPALKVSPGWGSPFVTEILLRGDRIIIVGAFDSVSGSTRANLARLNLDGSLDPGFVPSLSPGPILRGNPALPRIHEEAGLITFWSVPRGPDGGFLPPSLVRLSSDGRLDSTYAHLVGVNRSALSLVHPYAPLLLAQDDGRMLFAALMGEFATPTGHREMIDLFRLDKRGQLDPDFHARLVAGDGWPFSSMQIESAAAMTDGRILIAGYLSLVNGVKRPGFARLLPNGALDPSFDPTAAFNRIFNPDRAFDLINDVHHVDFNFALQPDGKVIIVGAGENQDLVHRLKSDGSLDTTFQLDESVSRFGDAGRAWVQPDGKILLAADNRQAAERKVQLLRILPDGGLDPSFRAISADHEIYSLVRLPDGSWLIGGSFTQVDGVPRAGLARLFGGPQATATLGVSQSAGRIKLTMTSARRVRALLETSADLTSWLPLRTNIADGVTLEFEDADAAKHRHRFYRAQVLVEP